MRYPHDDSTSEESALVVGSLVYNALRETMNVPEGDRFQIIAAHTAGDLVIDPHYLGIARTGAAILIQVTLNEGRTVEAKMAFFKAVADTIHESVGIRRQDVVIHLIETKKENGSFGNGEAQYA